MRTLAPEPCLFDAADTAGPRCRMCSQPARYMPSRNEHGAYCGGHQCTNPERLCQACGNAFRRGASGAGTKYCSVECRSVGYGGGVRTYTGRLIALTHAAPCAWCDQVSEFAPGRRGGQWPNICQPCLEPIKHVVPRLKQHHVPHDRALKLSRDPRCEICGRDVVAKVLNATIGRARSLLVVDHDHACCPADSFSCGACVRGLICSPCNAGLGFLQDDAAVLAAAAAYVDHHAATRAATLAATKGS